MTDVIVAVDAPSRATALGLVDRLGDAAGFYKVGLELFTREGPPIVEELRTREKRVFLDLKLHDIPHTVGRAVTAAGALGVELVTVHAAGGRSMLEAAVEAAEGGPGVLAVTVLTSLDEDGVGAVWGRQVDTVSEEVVRLSLLARDAGAAGVVASPAEVADVRQRVGPGFLLVTPGIRPRGADRHDQRRIATPADAVRAGADYLVVGRPVTAAAQPTEALAAIREEIAAAGSASARA